MRIAFFLFHIIGGVLLALVLVVLAGGLLSIKPIVVTQGLHIQNILSFFSTQDYFGLVKAAPTYAALLLRETWVAWGAVWVAVLMVLASWLRLNKPTEKHLQDQNYFIEENLKRVSKREQDLLSQVNMAYQSVQEAFAGKHDACALMNTEGLVLFVNSTAQEQLNTWLNSESIVTQRLIKDVVPHYERSVLPQAFTTVANRQVEQNAWHGDVNLPQAMLAVRLFVVAGPDTPFVVLLWRDISNQKVSLAEQEAALGLNQHLLAQLPTPAAVLDAQGQFVFVSAAWRKLFRLVDESWQGLPYYKQDILVPHNWSDIKARVLKGESLDGQDTVTLFDEERTFAWRISPWTRENQALAGVLVQLEDVTEQQISARRLAQLEEQENKLAYNDLLTGLPNRQLFNDRLSMALATAYRQLNKVGLLFLDLDGFKAVNDALGHDVGDMLLKEVAERLLTCVRQTDTVARLGGDEFTAILNVRDANDAENIALKMIERINQPYNLGGHENVRVSTSIGISMYPEQATAAPDLVRMADAAMYVAKQSGKNQHKFYTQDYDKDAPIAEDKPVEEIPE